MRTLNKALCLILALVMVLGLGVFSVSAADENTAATAATRTWSDADQIKYDEAAAVLSSMGIMQGRDDGTYDPHAELNRQEGAVMITRLLGQTKNLSGNSKFADVDNPDYAPYIAYVEKEGIIAGFGDGNFYPYEKLTGVQFAKMLLGALGYKADIEGMVGTQWELTVLKLIRSTELDKGLDDFDATQPVTREVAAHMLLNTLKTPMVHYEASTQVSVNGATVSISNSNAKFVVTDSLSKQTISKKYDINSNHYLVEFAEEYWKDLRLIDFGETHDKFGRKTNKWTYKNNDVGEWKDLSDLIKIYEGKVTQKALYDLVGSNAFDSIKNGHSELYAYRNGEMVAHIGGYTRADGIEVKIVEDWDTLTFRGEDYLYSASGSDLEDAIANYMDKNNTFSIFNAATFSPAKTGKGVTTEVYLSSDNNLTLVTYYTWVFQASSNYNSNNGSINVVTAGDTDITLDSNRLDENDFEQIKNYKADDYLLINASTDHLRSQYHVEEVQLATKVTGKVDSYWTDGDKNVTIDGKKYSYSYTTKDDEIKSTKYSTGQNVTVVLDQTGNNVIEVVDALTINDYVFIREFGDTVGGFYSSSNAYASAVFADGSLKTIKVRTAFNYNSYNDVDDADIANYGSSTVGSDDTERTEANIAQWGAITAYAYDSNGNQLKDDESLGHAGKWYTYTKNSSGEYTLYDVAKDKWNAGALYYGNRAITDNGYQEYGTDVTNKERIYFANISATATQNLISGKSGYTDAVNREQSKLGNLKANDDTVVIVEKNDKKLFMYKGVKEIPRIYFTNDADENDTVGVYASYDQDDKIANVVYIKIDGNNIAVNGAANANLVYLKEYKGENRVFGADTAWLYKAIDEKGEEYDLWADTKISDVTNWGAYYLEMRDGVLTDFEVLNKNPNNDVDGLDYINLSDNDNYRMNQTIDVSGNVITFKYNNGASKTMTADKNTQIMLVAQKAGKTDGVSYSGAGRLLKDENSTQYYAGLTLKTLGDYVKDYYMTYHVEAEFRDNDSDVLDKLFVTVVEMDTEKGGDATAKSDVQKLTEYINQNKDALGNVTYNGDITIDSSDTLTIAKGINLRLNGNLYVNGTLKVNGTLEVTKSLTVYSTGYMSVSSTGDVTAVKTSLREDAILIVKGGTNDFGAMTVMGYVSLDAGTTDFSTLYLGTTSSVEAGVGTIDNTTTIDANTVTVDGSATVNGVAGQTGIINELTSLQ